MAPLDDTSLAAGRLGEDLLTADKQLLTMEDFPS